MTLANEICEKDDINYQRLARKMHRGHTRRPAEAAIKNFINMNKSPMDQRKGRRRPVLTPVEKLSIVHAVIIEH